MGSLPLVPAGATGTIPSCTTVCARDKLLGSSLANATRKTSRGQAARSFTSTRRRWSFRQTVLMPSLAELWTPLRDGDSSRVEEINLGPLVNSVSHLDEPHLSSRQCCVCTQQYAMIRTNTEHYVLYSVHTCNMCYISEYLKYVFISYTYVLKTHAYDY